MFPSSKDDSVYSKLKSFKANKISHSLGGENFTRKFWSKHWLMHYIL